MQTTAKRLSGVCAAVLTPIDAFGRPDFVRASTYYRRLLDGGADALNVLGTTGEANSIAVRDRIALMEHLAASGLPMERMMVGTGSCAVAEAIELTRAAIACGFAGALVLPPFYYKGVSEDGVFDYYARIIQTIGTGVRIYLYHFPQMSAVPITPELVARLTAAFGACIAGVKDSSGDMSYSTGLVERFPQLAVFPSTEEVLLDARERGFAGCISATVSLSADRARRVWHDRSAHDARYVSEVRNIVKRWNLISAVRAVTAEMENDDSWNTPLPPNVPLDEGERKELFAALRSAGH